MMDFVVVIPARYASTRLPGKALLNINGKPMLQHVYERGSESGAAEVIVATDSDEIADVVESFGGTVCMTGDHHRSGTERIAEVADILDWSDETIVVNLQGDEPTMPPALIDQCASLLSNPSADIATLASTFQSQQDFENPNCVKVVRDQNERAIYFSRAAIPFARGDENTQRAMESALHHHGIYAYRCGVLRQFVQAEASPLEISEHLEQLRALSMGMTIVVGIPEQRPGAGVDTQEDLVRAARELKTIAD